MSIILIQNTSAQQHGIGRKSNNKAGAQVQDTLVTLKPGLNKVPAKDWDEAKKQKMVIKNMDEGVFVEMKEVDSLKKLSPPEALKMIELAMDVPMLTEWLDNESRAKVSDALEARLAVLAKPEPGTTKSKLKD